MDVWLTYSPEDFLLFSEEVYWRLFELHNAALWPGQFGALAAGAMVVAAILRQSPRSGRTIAGILALAWTVGALAFLPRYATINWLAGDLAWGFLAQAILLSAFGIYGDALRPCACKVRRAGGAILAAYGIFLHPFLSVMAGRPISGGELFALTPDPTAIVTLGAVAAAGWTPRAALLAVLPLAWCFASWATLATLGTWEAWVLPAAVLASLLIGLVPRRAGQTNLS
ncbi:DUF6064 family protein [Nisaea sediminum]|uniref:DUF6064 family protein n=1 Tax=Nisaea sediminum TaxID=2775867 RepID=UPI001868D2E6|nr:DUF6064 family protein [Nisaea sediminum]